MCPKILQTCNLVLTIYFYKCADLFFHLNFGNPSSNVAIASPNCQPQLLDPGVLEIRERMRLKLSSFRSRNA